MFRSWNDRDSKWLFGILISIIILLVASIFAKDKNIELNFSIISSAVSIALALIAIVFAWKQDSENQTVTRETSKLLSIITTKIESMDNKIDKLDPIAVTRPEKNELISEIEKIINSKDGEINPNVIEEINNSINQKFKSINNKIDKFYNTKQIERKYTIELSESIDDEEMNYLVSVLTRQLSAEKITINTSFEGNTKVSFIVIGEFNILDEIPKILNDFGYKLNTLQIN